MDEVEGADAALHGGGCPGWRLPSDPVWTHRAVTNALAFGPQARSAELLRSVNYLVTQHFIGQEL